MAATAALLAGAAAAAGAAAFTSPERAIAEAFPGARIERRPVTLEPARVKEVQRRAQARLPGPLVTPYLAYLGDSLAGVAFFERRVVRTMPATLMTVVGPDSTVSRVEILAFHEPPDYRPPARWLGLWRGRRVADGTWPGRDLPSLAGATLSARAITESARLAVALWEIVVAPSLTTPPPPVSRKDAR